MLSLVVIQSEVKQFKDLYDRTCKKHGIKMKSYVAVQKKLLTMIYYLWNKNESYDANYKINIQEREQELNSLFAFEKGTKNSLNRIEATQGNLPVNHHSMLPLC
jgi:transposase